MNVVETRKYGETIVRFCDDYCEKVDETEIKKVLKEITDKTLMYLRKKSA